MSEPESAALARSRALALIIVGVLLAVIGGLFFFGPGIFLLLPSVLTLGFGLAKRAKARSKSVVWAWLRSVIYVLAIAFVMFMAWFASTPGAG